MIVKKNLIPLPDTHLKFTVYPKSVVLLTYFMPYSVPFFIKEAILKIILKILNYYFKLLRYIGIFYS